MKKTDDAKALFAKTLQRLAKMRGFRTADALAASLELNGDHKKWLVRIWSDGLARPDKRRTPILRELAQYLGVKNEHDFWNAAAEPKISVIADHNYREWRQLVEAVTAAIWVFMFHSSKHPFAEALEQYEGFEEGDDETEFLPWHRIGFVTEFAKRFFLSRFDDDPKGKAFLRLAKHLVKCLEDFETESIRSRAQGLVENRREWQEKYPVLVTACKGDGRVIEDTLFDMWRFVYLMPPSDEELAERFVKQYLAKDPLGDDD